MKTSVVMIRKMGEFDVTQRTKDGYFDGNSILNQWNSVDGNKRRQMDRFLESTKTKEFIQALEDDLAHEQKRERAFYKIKGRNTAKGRTTDKVWMNPLLYIDFCMYLNPTFKLAVLKFVYDELIKNRHLAGDNYKVLTLAGSKLKGYNFAKVAVAIQWIVFNKTGSNLRQTASQEQLQEITDIEQKFAFAIDMGYIKTYRQLIKGLQDTYKSKGYTPIEK